VIAIVEFDGVNYVANTTGSRYTTKSIPMMWYIQKLGKLADAAEVRVIKYLPEYYTMEDVMQEYPEYFI